MSAYKTLIAVSSVMALLATVEASAAGRDLVLTPAEQAEVDQQAARGLATARRLVAVDDPADFGLRQREEVARFQLGRPLQAYHFERPALNAFQADQAATQLIASSQVIHYPVMVDGTVRFLLSIEKGESGWKLASIGSANLGKGLTLVLERFAGTRGSIMLVESGTARAAFALVKEQGGRERLFYLYEAPWSFNPNVKNDGAELRLGELVPQLRDAMDAFASPAHVE
jgi:hypothetical protein